MSLDPQVKHYLDMMAAGGAPPITQMSVEQARRFFVDRIPLIAGTPAPVHHVEDRRLHSGVLVRIYRPRSDQPLPMLVYYHGGGWVIGDCDTIDAAMRRLANAAGMVVASVDYRMAPEHQFPGPVHDCYHAARNLIQIAPQIGADPRRVALGGDSAGGNLTAAVLLLARKLGALPIRHQLLVYPVTDFNFDTASYRQYAEGYGLTRDAMRWFWNHYLPDSTFGADPLASPLREKNLSHMPPATVIVAGFDVLKDEVEAYAAKLADQGVKVDTLRYPGMIHGFFAMPGLFDQTLQAIEQSGARLKAAFA